MHNRGPLGKALSTLALLIGCVACAAVEQTDQIVQPVGQVLQGGVGDSILTVNSYRNLPNAFGKADILGRTTPTGMVNVQYLGVTGSVARFIRRGVILNTGATTVNSTPLIIPNTSTSYTSGTIGDIPVTGSSATYGPPIIVPARPPEPQVLPQGAVIVELDLQRDKTLIVSGRRLVVIDATPATVTYRIE